MQGDKRFALLIDSDNISSKYIPYIIDELNKYGSITYKRSYGDWTKQSASVWRERLLEHSINPIQQFNNTKGKNSTDSAMIIDAMDILYTNNVNGFCIVSSDSDFTRLASRLKESGMEVIGMGEKKTPNVFKVACNIFKTLELLVDEEGEQEKDVTNNDNILENSKTDEDKTLEVVNKNKIEKYIQEIINENNSEGKDTGLGEIGSRLVRKYTDFDVRNYGYTLLSKFLEDMKKFKLTKNNSTIIVTINENKSNNRDIIEFIKNIVKVKQRMSLSALSNEVHEKYKKFSVKNYGYSTFSKFVQSIEGLDVSKDKKVVKYIQKNS